MTDVADVAEPRQNISHISHIKNIKAISHIKNIRHITNQGRTAVVDELKINGTIFATLTPDHIALL